MMLAILAALLAITAPTDPVWPKVVPETKPAEESQIRPVGPYWRAKVALTNEVSETLVLEAKPVEARMQFAGPSTAFYLNGKKVVANGYFRNMITWDVTRLLNVGTNELRLVNASKVDWAQWVQGELFMRRRDGSVRYLLMGDNLPKAMKGSNPKLPDYEGSIRLNYTDYRYPQKAISATGIVSASRTCTFTFDFEGAHLPEFPFDAVLEYEVGGVVRWRDCFVVTHDMVMRTHEPRTTNHWQLRLTRPAPKYLELENAEVHLRTFALYCWNGKLPPAKVSIHRATVDDEFPSPVIAGVTNIAGLARFTINGKPTFVFAGAAGEDRPDFTRRHSDAPINVTTVGAPRFHKWWPKDSVYDFTAFDENAEMHARDVPGAYFMMDISVYPPKDWLAANPDERPCDEEGKVCATHQQAFSFSSKKAIERMEKAVIAAIDHIERSPYANRVIGYRVNSGDTIEWLGWRWNDWQKPLDFSPAAKREFAHIPNLAERSVTPENDVFWEIPEHRNVVDYHRYISNVNADNIIRLCQAAKRACGGRKLVGTYYGYTMTMFSNGSEQMRCHFALKRLLKSGAVDYLMSPQPYAVRNLGDPIGDMKPFATLNAHNVVSVIEDDTRTSVSRCLPKGMESCLQLQTLEQTIGICRRNMATALCRGQYPYMIGLCSGTEFDFPQFGKDAAICRRIGEELLNTGRHAEIAVVVSEEAIKAMPLMRKFHGHSRESEQAYNRDGSVRRLTVGGAAICYEAECQLYKRLAWLGAPVDYVLAEDLAEHEPRYKLYIFSNAYLADEKLISAVARLRESGAHCLWMTAPGYMSEKGNSLASMKALTGFDFEKIVGGKSSAIMSDGRIMGSHSVPVSPRFSVTLPKFDDVEVLGKWPSGEIAVAAKGNDFFCGVFTPDHLFLADVAKRSGVHIYSESGDPIEANDRLVMLHARNAGKKVIRLPHTVKAVYDVFNRKLVARDTDTFELVATLHSSWLFYLNP